MERLKSIIPDTLKQTSANCTSDELSFTCSSFLDFFQQSPLFHQIVGDLTDPKKALCVKDKKVALELKSKGNQCFSNEDYTASMSFYSQALRVSPSNKDLLTKLYVNRAASFHKMDLLSECLRDCNRALVNTPSYAKAWFRRGKANSSSGNYEDAIKDFKISLKMELSSSGKRQIESELQTILQHCKDTNDSSKNLKKDARIFHDELNHIQLNRVSIPNKGRGMISESDITQSSLIHKEDPYAAIILKQCRETHCHFCFNELPLDMIVCTSCTIPLYCSENCLKQAGGQILSNIQKDDIINLGLSNDLEEYMLKVSLSSLCNDNFSEHMHECGGVHWPTILPSEVILAGRVLMRRFCDVPHLTEKLDLCENYEHLPCESRLDLLIYSIVLMFCLQLPLNGDTASQIVIILSQVRINSMAIIRMKSSSAGEAFTNTVEQVKVGQAIYLSGSSFNHSCKPNIHAYFLSRTLYIRATEFVLKGSELELSYGPQVGQQDCKNRQQFLEDRYSFICQCTGCTKPTLSDLVITAYRCVEHNCFGVVLEKSVAKYENYKLNSLGNELNIEGVLGVANHVFEPSYCSNCGTYCDLEVSLSKVRKAETYFKRMEDAIASEKISPGMVFDGLKCINLLKKVLHPLNKRIAEAEDNLARAYSLVGELRTALDHCQSSIKILEKLYDTKHIVIGNELIKLASLQVLLKDSSALESINRITAIFSHHYGSHIDKLFPYLLSLKGDASKILS